MRNYRLYGFIERTMKKNTIDIISRKDGNAMAKRTHKGELMYITNCPHTWASLRATVYMYEGYFDHWDYLYCTKRQIINGLRKNGIKVPRSLYNC